MKFPNRCTPSLQSQSHVLCFRIIFCDNTSWYSMYCGNPVDFRLHLGDLLLFSFITEISFLKRLLWRSVRSGNAKWHIGMKILKSCSLYSFLIKPTDAGLMTAVIKPAWHIPVPSVQWKTPDDGQRNCSKHVEFFFDKNKFGKISEPVGFIKNKFFYDARSHELKNGFLLFLNLLFTWQSSEANDKLSNIVFIRPLAVSIVSEQFLCTFSFVTDGSYSLTYVRITNGCKWDYIVTEVGRVATVFWPVC